MVARRRAGSSPLSSMGSGNKQTDNQPENRKATKVNGDNTRIAAKKTAPSTPNLSPKRKTPSKAKVKKEEASDEEMPDGHTEIEASSKTPKSTPRKRVKTEHPDDAYVEATPATTANKIGGRRTRGSAHKSYTDDIEDEKKDIKEDTFTPSKKSTPSKASTLAKKLKQLEAYLQTPFPEHAAPSPEQCQEVQDGLAAIHGLPRRPEKLLDIPGAPAGCGAVPDVLDALVRTILSQNTTSKNSTAAKNAVDAKFGRADYVAVHKASNEDLEDTIRCGGLAQIKARVIKQVIASCVERQISSGEIKDESDLKRVSLDYLHDMSDLDAMKELVSFDGVGPKTASCVLLFCLGRNSFAVDTHVFRITKALGWTPAKANRETAFQHLDVRIPDENKYPLHALLVRHGRSCRLCSANGNITDPEVDSSKCPIKAFIKAKRTSKSGNDAKDDDDDDVHDLLPGEIEDEDEKKGKPPAGPPPGMTELESQWDGKVAGHS